MKNRVSWLRAAMVLLITITVVSADAQRGRGPRHNYNWKYYPARGQRFYSVPSASIRLTFGGLPYYYSGGIYYRPYGNYYRVIPPPIGIHISTLPAGYWPMRWGGGAYFYFNGIFYRHQNNGYEVVRAPVGADVPEIPRDANVVVIDGNKYYEYNGTYFQEFTRSDGEIWYHVTGKNGVLNTGKADHAIAQNDEPVYQELPEPADNARPAIGDVVNTLPADCKTVIINNKKFYVSADHVYYEEFIENNTLKYKVAGR
ncbi:DUF6515 family protein [Sediminibacterium ginsengisoli]|uniref:DKNYY family protein n=1 Tax=Sediminibacterium ginsengisoli TaxID=413434 RepID=A0A1T4M2C7_9BACT|nr:DUF6515 family protein [Sediminibacterium ginsengisoli]SJZ61092.1 hypothetical protein SAMN04488132_103125 [Sediminibacterium ginsengisoli]